MQVPGLPGAGSPATAACGQALQLRMQKARHCAGLSLQRGDAISRG